MKSTRLALRAGQQSGQERRLIRTLQAALTALDSALQQTHHQRGASKDPDLDDEESRTVAYRARQAARRKATLERRQAAQAAMAGE